MFLVADFGAVVALYYHLDGVLGCIVDVDAFAGEEVNVEFLYVYSRGGHTLAFFGAVNAVGTPEQRGDEFQGQFFFGEIAIGAAQLEGVEQGELKSFYGIGKDDGFGFEFNGCGDFFLACCSGRGEAFCFFLGLDTAEGEDGEQAEEKDFFHDVCFLRVIF